MADLSDCTLFKGLRVDEIESLLNDLTFQVKTFSPGSVIVFMNDPCTRLLIVSEGTVVAEMVNLDGRSIRIEELSAPCTLAEAFVFGRQNAFPVTVIAQTECSVISIPRDELMKLFSLNQSVLLNFLDAISNRTQFLTHKIRFLSFKTIKGKIASYVLDIAGDTLKTVTLPMTQENLANYFGVARPSLARALGELQDEGAISVNRKEISITDRSILVAYLDE